MFFKKKNKKINTKEEDLKNFLSKNNIYNWEDYSNSSDFVKYCAGSISGSDDIDIRILLSNEKELKEYLKEMEEIEDYEKCRKIKDIMDRKLNEGLVSKLKEVFGLYRGDKDDNRVVRTLIEKIDLLFLDYYGSDVSGNFDYLKFKYKGVDFIIYSEYLDYKILLGSDELKSDRDINKKLFYKLRDNYKKMSEERNEVDNYERLKKVRRESLSIVEELGGFKKILKDTYLSQKDDRYHIFGHVFSYDGDIFKISTPSNPGLYSHKITFIKIDLKNWKAEMDYSYPFYDSHRKVNIDLTKSDIELVEEYIDIYKEQKLKKEEETKIKKLKILESRFIKDFKNFSID